MKCIYEVQYEAQWEHSEGSRWEAQSVKVFSGPDALEAVGKAREAALAKGWLDDNGVEHQCSRFRLRGVALVAEAEL